MSQTLIEFVEPGSPGARAGVRAGDTLLAVNGHPVSDVLDYKFYASDEDVTLSLRTARGRERKVRLRNEAGEDLGLDFGSWLMDSVRSCCNRCVFCFVDQLPAGMRETLYFKDDDARLSFLTGSYITLTNLSERELERICALRISPIHVSVHATDPEVRCFLLGNRRAGEVRERMERLASAGICMHCQIVACPGINDGEVLQRTMEDLAALHPRVESVSVVPVGLTRHREGLYPMEPYDAAGAAGVLDRVEAFAEKCLGSAGSRIFWCSDEFYLRAGRPVPEDGYYEEYFQLENGVGMLRLLRTEFDACLNGDDPSGAARDFSAACGTDAAAWIREMVEPAARRAGARCHVYPVINDFLGSTITVSGLVTGRDLIAQLKDKDLGERLLLPENMIRHEGDVFLDDVSCADVARELNVEVEAVGQDGGDLYDAVFDIPGGRKIWRPDGSRVTDR